MPKYPVNDEPIEIGGKYYSSLADAVAHASINWETAKWCEDRIRRGERAMQLLRRIEQQIEVRKPEDFSLMDEAEVFLEANPPTDSKEKSHES